jgi:phosphoglycerate dehydrogenase-like enzyme
MGELAIVEGKTRLKQRRASPQTITPEQIETFFETLVATCNVVRAAKAAGFSANWAYRRRRIDAAFRNGWAAAVREGYSKLELVLLERAIKGTPKLVRTAKGNDRIMREYSTALAVALLRRHAEMAASTDHEPGEDELSEVRERIMEKLEGLRRRELESGEVETKGWAGRIETIRWALQRIA